MKTLDEAIKETEIERAQRYPLLDISTNVNELSEIAEEAAKYVVEMNDELAKPEPWEFVVQSVMQVLTATFKYLDQRKSTDFSEVYIDLGKLFRVAISYGVTKNADKNATFNPVINVGQEMAYASKDAGYNDLMTADMAKELEDLGLKYLHPMFFDNKEQMKEIFEKAANNLASKYGIKIPESEALSYIFVAFFRKAKEYFINHKDEDEVEIKLGRLITMGIDKEADGDYFIYVTPGQEFKMANAKGDNKTEIKETE